MSFLGTLLVVGSILAEFAVDNVHTFTTGNRIIGGKSVSIADFPYQIALMLYSQHRCGGAIIDKNWILTAAHCVGDPPFTGFSIRSGSSFNSTGGNVQKVNPSDIIRHEKYQFGSAGYDIALIRVSKSLIQVNSVAMPVALPYFNQVIPSGSIAYATGWGMWDALPWISSPVRLQAGRLKIFDLSECQAIYGSIPLPVTDMEICAVSSNSEKRIGTCKGDSGGPLVVDDVVVGVVSRGWGCATLPGIFTNVASFRQWIYEKARI